jgi:ArsR family transcriptional regulator
MSKSRLLSLSDISACEYAPMVREPLSADAAGDVAAKLKALADPIRLRLFSLVASHAGGEACVCDISGDFDVTQPTISHHLKVLKDAGLLASERRASWVYYSVVPEALRNLSAVLSIATDDAARTGASA